MMLKRLKDIFNQVGNWFKREAPAMMLGSGYSPNYWGDYGSGAKFPSGLSRGAPINIYSHTELRQQARDAMYDSPVARGMVERFSDTVVDTGLRVKPTPMADVLGVDPEAAETWGEDVAQRFHMWAKSKKSHRSRINNFYQNQHLYHEFQQRDNDIFARFYYTKDWDQFNPLSIDFVDPNQIKGYDYTSSYAQFGAEDGITRDAAGREISYLVWNFDKDGKYQETTIPAMGEKSGRVFMVHGYRPEMAGQGRGYSRLAHAIQEFENLTDFNASTIRKAIEQASFVMAVENDQQDASQPLAGRVAGPVAPYAPSTTSDSSTGTGSTPEPNINWKAMPEATIHQPGSVIIGNLRRGDKIKNLQDTSPSAQYNMFVDAFCSYLCASVGMPIEILLMKFNQNYSASRACLILFWRVAQIWRDEMASDFLDPAYEMWLSEEIAAGRISAPGWSDPLLRAAWLSCEWSGAPMPNIDPQKSFEADKGYVGMGAQTLDDVARNLNGSSGKANRLKNARQFQELPEPPWDNKSISNNQNQDENNQSQDGGTGE